MANDDVPGSTALSQCDSNALPRAGAARQRRRADADGDKIVGSRARHEWNSVHFSGWFNSGRARDALAPDRRTGSPLLPTVVVSVGNPPEPSCDAPSGYERPVEGAFPDSPSLWIACVRPHRNAPSFTRDRGGRRSFAPMARLKIAQVKEATSQEWDAAWEHCRYATYFHSRLWAEIWETYSGYMRPEPKLIVFSDGLTAVLPLSRCPAIRMI